MEYSVAKRWGKVKIKFKCPACGDELECDVSDGGKALPCPFCGTAIEVPVLSDGETSPSPKRSVALLLVLLVALVAALSVAGGAWLIDRNNQPVAAIQPVAPTTAAAQPPASAPTTSPEIERSPEVSPLPPDPVAATPRPMVVHGGAWITRKNGSSDIQRGLEIGIVDGDRIDKEVADLASGLVKEFINKSKSKTLTFDQDLTFRLWAVHAETLVTKSTSRAAWAEFASHLEVNSLVENDRLALGYRKVLLEAVAMAVTSGMLVPTKTDVRGEYSLDFDQSQIANPLVVSILKSDVLLVVWCVPVKTDRADFKVDLDNSNAIIIENFR